MIKFTNIKVKRVNSHLKYIVSKLVKKRPRQKKGRNTKTATMIQVSRRKRQYARRHHAKKQHAKKQYAKRHNAKMHRKKGNLQNGHNERSFLRIMACILKSII